MRTRFLIVLSLIILGEIYSFILIRSATKQLQKPWNSILLTTYIVVSIATYASFFMMRKIDWTQYPHFVRNVFIAFTIGFLLAKILAAAIMLIDDLRRLVVFIFLKIKPSQAVNGTDIAQKVGVSRSQFLKSSALILGGSTIAGFLYGIKNRYNYQVRKVKLNFSNLPNSFKGLKIVQISDIHSGSFDNHEAVAKGVAMVMEQKPDIIFFTGDLVNNKADEIKPYINIFSKLYAPLGVYSTLGNHDYGDYVEWPSAAAKKANLEELKQIHRQMGWHLMMNEHVVLEKNEEKIAVVGIENWGAKAGFPKYGDMRKAYHGLSEKNIPFKILLSHDPSHWDAQVTTQYKDIDLTLSGHTHGMQFGIEIPGWKWSPVKYIYRNWAGLAQQGKQYLYVNRGFGFLGYPGRLGIMPEITSIELV